MGVLGSVLVAAAGGNTADASAFGADAVDAPPDYLQAPAIGCCRECRSALNASGLPADGAGQGPLLQALHPGFARLAEAEVDE
jgi:hypothetical protein